MKKERNPIVVILSIFFLSLFIILPPTFRNLIPRDEYIIESDSNKENLIIVVCNKDVIGETYKVTSKSKYVNGKIESNTLTYTLKDTVTNNNQTQTDNNQVIDQNTTTIDDNTVNQSNVDPNPTDNTKTNQSTTESSTNSIVDNKTIESTVLTDIDYFKSIPNLDIVESGNTTVININKDVVNNNSTEEVLISHFNNSYRKQIKFYQENGYTCNKMEG